MANQSALDAAARALRSANAPAEPREQARPCVTCGQDIPGQNAAPYEMPSLLNPTLYACCIECYERWALSR